MSVDNFTNIFSRALDLIPPPAPSKFVKPALTSVSSDLTLILLLHHNPLLYRDGWLSWSLYWLKLIITFMIALKETMQFIDQKKCSLLHQKNSKFTMWIKCFCGNKAWYQGNQSLNLAWRHLIQWQNTVFEVQLQSDLRWASSSSDMWHQHRRAHDCWGFWWLQWDHIWLGQLCGAAWVEHPDHADCLQCMVETSRWMLPGTDFLHSDFLNGF